MTDYSSIIDSLDSVAPKQAITSLDANPDDGARALQLSRSTGVAPLTVYNDLDGFEQQHRSSLTAGIVRNNTQLAAYLRGNPLADVVSNDDYGNLDKFSQSVPDMGWLDKRFSKYIAEPIYAGAKGAYTGAKEALTEPYREEDIDPLTKSSAPYRYAFHVLDIGHRLIGALAGATFGGARGFAEEETRAITGSENIAGKVGREVQGIIESEMGRGGEHAKATAEAGQLLRAGEAMKAAKPWVDAGVEPPRGLHPMIDEAKADINAAALERLDQNLADAQASLTKERSDALFQKFAEQHYGDSTIAISGDRVSALYGDKVPEFDDGVLGWVPRISEKLEAARLGEDVHIPLADWMTRVDPKLAKELHDDLRVWSGGITANEAKELWEPKPVVDSPMAKARDALGTEPMFSIGDRKLELKQLGSMPGFEEFHEFQFHDQDGKPVGELTIVPDPMKKELYIANINGLAGLYANSFGPSLVRDIKRQLKELYPEYETVTGHRVSGARYEAGVTEDVKKSHPKVKLSTELDTYAEYINARQIYESAARANYGWGITALPEPTEFLFKNHAAISQAIQQEIARLTGGGLEYHPVSEIKSQTASRPRGVFFPGGENLPKILIDLFGPDSMGVARHESIHYLKSAGLIKPDEWGALVTASHSEGWLERYGIEERYPDLTKAKQHEEAIAEAFRDWMQNREGQPTTFVTQIFEKILKLWEGVQTKFKEMFGRELSAEELFQKIESGEVGRREGEAQEQGPSFSIEDANAKMDNLRASASGLDAKSFAKIQKLIQARFEEDISASMKRAERDQARMQTKEWKEASKELAKEVESTIRQRPDVMADLLIGSGEVAGKKLKQRYPLRADDLTPEQKALLPRHYYSADGLPVDGVAKMVGFTSGDAMIEKLAEYNKDKGTATAQEMLKKTIADETARQMEARHGDLQANIMRDAQDQALSENELNILAEEWQGAAMQAGVSVVDKDVAKVEALRVFGNMRVGDIDSGRLMTQMLKHYRDATQALIAGKPADAIVRLQRRYEVGLIAAEAKKLEKAQRAFDKTAKQFTKREVPSVDPEYTNFIHGILMQVGKPVRRSIQDLEKQISAGESKDLAEFIQNKTQSLREVPVWDQLYDQTWRKNLDDLTATEFQQVHDSIKALVFNGRDEKKIYRQGEAADFAEIKKDLIDSIAESVNREIRAPKPATLLKRYFVGNLQMENIFNRWDSFDAKGKWNQYVMRDLVDGANQVDAWKKEYAKKIKELDSPKGLNKSVDNPLFRDQDTDTLIPFSRQNLIAVMLNTGTQSNLVKMAKGYKLDPGDVMTWVHEHAREEDWKFVQGVWDTFKSIKVKADTMYRSLSGGVSPEDIPVTPVQTRFGTLPGGYYPVIFHPEMEGPSKKLMGQGPLEQEGFVRAATPAGWTKSRTGYVAPLTLDMDQMPGRISQILHDIGLRPAVLNAAKVFYDKDVRSAVRKYYGEEYKEGLVSYLQAVANSSNRDTKSQVAWSRASEFFRQNMITTLVGLNPGTVMKHGPSALVTSMREVGMVEFAKAVKGLFSVNEVTGESNWQFAIKNSLELQRRDRNWQETLYGATAELAPGAKFFEWRQRIMEWSSKPVAISDMLSAVPTWLAAYEKEMGVSGVHGDAIYAADRAVRRAHGSTAITSRTAIQRDWNPWLTSVYNYFSDIMNRQMETIWKAGDTLDLVKEKNYKAAMATVPALTASLFAYVLWPAIVEHLVAPSEDDPKDSWAKKAGKQMAFTISASWPGVRDVGSALVHGKDPQFGLTGTGYQELSNLFRDFNKDKAFSRDHAGRLIQDSASFIGATTGMVPAQIGRVGRYLHDVDVGIEHPRGAWSWATGLRFGTTKHHSTTVENFMKGRNQ